jgi:hypothetical protein
MVKGEVSAELPVVADQVKAGAFSHPRGVVNSIAVPKCLAPRVTVSSVGSAMRSTRDLDPPPRRPSAPIRAQRAANMRTVIIVPVQPAQTEITKHVTAVLQSASVIMV